MKKFLFAGLSILLLGNPLIIFAVHNQNATMNQSEGSQSSELMTSMYSEKTGSEIEELIDAESDISSQVVTGISEDTTESIDEEQVTQEIIPEIKKADIAGFLSNNDEEIVSPYLNDQEQYQELLEEIKKQTDYATGELTADTMRAGKNKGVAEFLGITPAKLLNQLKKHQSDRYYLGTPFRGLWVPNAQNMSPLGNPNKYGPGFNCTGFVATAFRDAGANNSEITKRANAWGGIANAYNWRNALVPNVEYYTFNSVAKLLSSGKAEKGDILYFEPNFSIPGYDPHIGFFWGNTSSHNRMWHSYDANIMSNIKAGRPWTKIYLFKLKQTKPKNEQGKYKKIGKYVQVKSKNYEILKNFEWETKGKSSVIYNKTYLAKGKYDHKNGKTYYSIYDHNNKWIGYINSKGTKITESQGGAIDNSQYVTLKKKGYKVWTNFQWEKRYLSDEKLGQQFKAKKIYNHFNGSVFYSLYDMNDKWQGYINKDALSIDPIQGFFHKMNKTVQVKSTNYNVYQNFSWKVKAQNSVVYKKTYIAKGYYKHYNGSTFYSIYTPNDKWIGYINSSATKETEPQGDTIGNNEYVTITKPGYSIWTNFSWKKRYLSDEKLGQQFKAKVKYNHVNGSVYYSLYDSDDKWQGYINKSGLSIDAPQGNYQKFGKAVKIVNKNAKIYQNFSWKVKQKVSNLKQKRYMAKGMYKHLNGSVYYSLYDSKDVWQGYINKKSVSLVTE